MVKCQKLLSKKDIEREIQDLESWLNAEGSGQCEHGFCDKCDGYQIRKRKEQRLQELQELLKK
jgi:hypothetical protein